jgi:hypothetical protein
MRGAGSRVHGRGRLLRSLRLLIRRSEKFTTCRADSLDEQAWARQFCDGLDLVWLASTRSEAARLALDAVDRRATIQRKTIP